MQIIKDRKIDLEAFLSLPKDTEFYSVNIQEIDFVHDFFSLSIHKVNISIHESVKDNRLLSRNVDFFLTYKNVFTSKREAEQYLKDKINEFANEDIEKINRQTKRLLNGDYFVKDKELNLVLKADEKFEKINKYPLNFG